MKSRSREINLTQISKFLDDKLYEKSLKKFLSRFKQKRKPKNFTKPELVKLEEVVYYGRHFGYKVSIYSNDHLEMGEPHFHLMNKQKKIDVRVSFDVNYLSTKKGYNGPDKSTRKALKELKKFSSTIRETPIGDMTGKEYFNVLWNENNPDNIISTQRSSRK